MNKELALGIDIGGTNTVIGIVDKSGAIHFEVSLVTTDYKTVNELSEAIHGILKSHHFLTQLVGVGIGAPNGNCFSGTIDFAPNLSWKGIIPIVAVFKEQFQLPVYLVNDANAAALGEHLFGCAHDLTDFVTITLGTGVGSGIFINNKLIEGAHGFAGEYGHIRVIPNGRLCGCGRKGCLETYTSSTGVVRSISEFVSPNKEKSVLMSMVKPSAKDVFDAAENGDAFAEEIVEEEEVAERPAPTQQGDAMSEKMEMFFKKVISSVYLDGVTEVTDAEGNPPNSSNNYLLSEDGKTFAGIFYDSPPSEAAKKFPFQITEKGEGSWQIQY
jgi:glucokinase